MPLPPEEYILNVQISQQLLGHLALRLIAIVITVTATASSTTMTRDLPIHVAHHIPIPVSAPLDRVEQPRPGHAYVDRQVYARPTTGAAAAIRKNVLLLRLFMLLLMITVM
jgi:hypothetical protein